MTQIVIDYIYKEKRLRADEITRLEESIEQDKEDLQEKQDKLLLLRQQVGDLDKAEEKLI